MVLGAYLLNMAWSVYNLIGAIVSLFVAYQKPIFRTSERIPILEDIKITLTNASYTTYGTLLDICEKGVGIKLNNNDCLFHSGDKLVLTIDKTKFQCEVKRSFDDFLGLRFINLSSNQMKIVMSIFVDNMQSFYKVNKIHNYTKNDTELPIINENIV